MPSPELGANMRRREFITLLGSAAVAWPLTAYAQQTSIPVIGLLGSATAKEWEPFTKAFLQGLNAAGMAEGRDVLIEYRWADSHYELLPQLATDLIQRRVTVIAAFTTPSAVAAKAATSVIPIVFTTIGDPVQIGLVASLSRPGANLTGVTYLNVELGPKLLQLLHETVPTAKTTALLVNPSNPNAEALSRSVSDAARSLGLELHILNVTNKEDIDQVFATAARLGVAGIVMASDAFLNTHGEELATLALRYRMPAIFQTRAFAAAGGLMSYGGDASEAYYQAGAYTARVLKGEKPADLPVQQTTKVELVVNSKTAKALGIDIPLSLIGRANEVIE